jgi:hypothetical protein
MTFHFHDHLNATFGAAFFVFTSLSEIEAIAATTSLVVAGKYKKS